MGLVGVATIDMELECCWASVDVSIHITTLLLPSPLPPPLSSPSPSPLPSPPLLTLTCTLATLGGSIRPELSPCTMVITPMVRVVRPHEFWYAYSCSPSCVCVRGSGCEGESRICEWWWGVGCEGGVGVRGESRLCDGGGYVRGRVR